MLLPVAAAAVALIAALAGFTMIKFFGVVFLGQPREAKLAEAHDAGRLERLGLLWLATGCILLGLFPNAVIALLDPVTTQLVGTGLHEAVSRHGWWLLAPVSEERASYSPAIFLGGIVVFTLFVYFSVRHFYHGRMQRGAAWDCGFPLQTGRMQDTAEGFGQPIRQIFSPFFRLTREHPSPFDSKPRYRVVVEDPFWYWLYLPVARLVERGTRLVAFLQQGRIAIYLLYSFITLLTLLVLTRG
jgi:NADH:ubiquinone oxidoreductase subunit 5 (subunit L)/multisubunit Na+/H+ antiporter MnhA subunit